MNLRSLLLVLTICGFLFTSCSNQSASDLLITYDDAAGFVQHSTFTTYQAHSGRVSVAVDSTNVYGVTFKAPFSLVAAPGFTKVHISAWMYTDSKENTSNLVVAVDSADKNILWNAIETKSFNPEVGKWTEITGSFDLNGVNKPNNILVIYPLHGGKGKAWFDDVSVKFE